MFCKDPFLNLLKQSGYSVVRLPRANFTPLQIMMLEKKNFTTLGQLPSVFSGVPPQISADVPAASISGQSTADMKLSFGLSLLGTIIGAMGGGTIGLDVAYNHARTVKFSFSEVLVDSVDLTLLDQYLSAGDIKPGSTHVSRLLDADDIYVVNSIVKSTRITVEAKAESGGSVAVSIPTVQQVVGANVKVESKSGNDSVITYEGNVPLTFGFQAARLFFDGGRYTAFKPVEAGAAAARAVFGAAAGADLFETSKSFISVTD